MGKLNMSKRGEVEFTSGDSFTLMDYIESMVSGNSVEQIDRAMATLEKKGWAQGDYQIGADGPVCSMGALRYDQRVWVKTLGYVAEAMGVAVEEIDDWNDQPGRTVEEVKAAFRRARDLAVLGESQAPATVDAEARP